MLVCGHTSWVHIKQKGLVISGHSMLHCLFLILQANFWVPEKLTHYWNYIRLVMYFLRMAIISQRRTMDRTFDRFFPPSWEGSTAWCLSNWLQVLWASVYWSITLGSHFLMRLPLKESAWPSKGQGILFYF